MKIYTSYYGNISALNKAGIMPISIARWTPRWCTGILTYKDVAPKPYMLNDELTEEEYIVLYTTDVLGKLNASDVIEKISRMTNGNDCALLCYEKPGDFCHRHLLAEWLEQNTGIEITEFGVAENKPKDTQQSLF